MPGSRFGLLSAMMTFREDHLQFALDHSPLRFEPYKRCRVQTSTLSLGISTVSARDSPPTKTMDCLRPQGSSRSGNGGLAFRRSRTQSGGRRCSVRRNDPDWSAGFLCRHRLAYIGIAFFYDNALWSSTTLFVCANGLDGRPRLGPRFIPMYVRYRTESQQ